MSDFFIRALIGGIGVALVTGPLGCFVVWRRMAFFGDSLSHGALLGVAIGFAAGIDVNAAILAVCIGFALILLALERQRRLATDTLLGILAQGTLALGLVCAALIKGVRIDVMGYLFGDVLAISVADLYWVYGGGAAILVVLAAFWRPLLAIAAHEELARAEGVPVRAAKLAFMLMVALMVAIAMKIVGVVLVTALLVIPAATARRLAGSPEIMAVLASLVGAAAVAGGLGASLAWDSPSGPSIVVAALCLFILGSAAAALHGAVRQRRGVALAAPAGGEGTG
ncbi:MAG: metal ABC transporter permease [Alphaproteobacteria bacterium]